MERNWRWVNGSSTDSDLGLYQLAAVDGSSSGDYWVICSHDWVTFMSTGVTLENSLKSIIVLQFKTLSKNDMFNTMLNL